MISNIIALRHRLHAHPEISLEEQWTSQMIYDFLRQISPSEIHKASSCTGLIATWHFRDPGPSVMLRAELDALPIQERIEAEYKSQIPGKAHLCGHDGHMSILCGVALRIIQENLTRGTLHLLFQPAEESGYGARLMLDDPALKHIRPDHVIALHNLPGFPKHQVLWRDGAFTTAVIGADIEFKGIESHAATPEKGINPAYAIARIVEHTKSMQVTDQHATDFTLITPIQIDLGRESYGIAAGLGHLRLCLRTWTTERLQTIQLQLEELVESICMKYDLSYIIKWKEPFHATENDPSTNQIILQAAKKLKLKTQRMQLPNRFGEDFGLFTDHFRGAMFCLGAGENVAPLHNPYYDFPDALLDTGINLFTGIVKEILEP